MRGDVLESQNRMCETEMKFVIHRLSQTSDIVSDSFHLLNKTIIIFNQISKILKGQNYKIEQWEPGRPLVGFRRSKGSDLESYLNRSPPSDEKSKFESI